MTADIEQAQSRQAWSITFIVQSTYDFYYNYT